MLFVATLTHLVVDGRIDEWVEWKREVSRESAWPATATVAFVIVAISTLRAPGTDAGFRLSHDRRLQPPQLILTRQGRWR